jgi:hypothetical protein
MGAIFPNETSVYFVAAGVAGSALATSDAVTTEISNFNISGGTKDVESVPFFGGATLDNEKPREQFEISFDVYVSYDNAARWEALLMGGNLSSSSAESSGESSLWRLFIEANDGTNYKTIAMNNCRAVTFEPEMGAEEYLKGTITFKFSPTDSAGLSNYKTANVAASNSYFD